MLLALVAHRHNETNLRLVEAAPPGVELAIMPPTGTLGLLGPGDAALARLDVLSSLAGSMPRGSRTLRPHISSPRAGLRRSSRPWS